MKELDGYLIKYLTYITYPKAYWSVCRLEDFEYSVEVRQNSKC